MNVFIKNKDYRRFSVASFLSSAGDVLFYLAFMTYASKLQNYSLAISLIAISESIPKLLGVFGGYFADKTQKKFKNIFICAVIRFLLYSLVGLLFITSISQWNLVLAIVIINFVSDTIGSYSLGLISPLVVDIVGESKFAEAEGFTGGISQIISMCAQFIGAGLLLLMSYSSLAFLNAGTFLLAGLLYATVGLKHKKDINTNERTEINEQGFWATMKSSFAQVKKQNGLLTTVLVIALLNGALDAVVPLINIVLVAHKSTMLIGTYSFTIALFNVVMGTGFAIGSMFGPQLFKKVSVFSTIIAANVASIITVSSVLFNNTYAVLTAEFLTAFIAGVGSIKLQQWLVTSVEHKILASTMGLLNVILMAIAPIMTTIMTTISGVINVNVSLILLITVEIITLITALTINVKSKNNLPVTEKAS